MPTPVAGQPIGVERQRGVGSRVVEDRDTPKAPGRAARRRAALVAAAVFAGVLAVILAAVQVMPTTFAATSIVSLMPRPASMSSADTVQMVGQKYVVIATSPTTIQAAGNAVGVRPEDLANATTAFLDIGTGNVEITVELPDRRQAVDAANGVAEVLVRRSRSDVLVQGEATSPAVVSRAVTKPARNLLRAAGTMAAVLAGVLAWMVVKGRSRWRRFGSVGSRPRDGDW